MQNMIFPFKILTLLEEYLHINLREIALKVLCNFFINIVMVVIIVSLMYALTNTPNLLFIV